MLNFNQLSSWLLDHGKQLWDCTVVPKRYLALLIFSIITFRGVSHAQFSCPDPSRCVSKDLQVVDAYIEGVDLCNTCTPGTTVTKKLYVAIANKTGSERTSFAVFANLSGGTFVSASPGGSSGTSISFCAGPIPANTTITTLAGTVTFVCGTELKLTDVFEAWTSAADAHNSCAEILADKCASIAPKCGTLSELVIRTPLAVTEVSHTNVACNGGKTGSIDINVTGGTQPYTYSWSNGATTQDISGLAAGTYTVTVKDANNCSATLSVTITEPAALSLSETHTNVACNGGKTGSIDLSVSGGTAPYTYSWTNGATTQDISGLAAGDYTVTVTDANKCTQTLKVTITEPSAIKPTETHTNVACNGDKTGSIDLSVTGGVAPYTYSWSNGATTQDISGLAAGDYTVTITDANKCTATLKVTITEASAIKLTETHTNVACNGGNTGSIDLSVTGGTAPYTYSWSNGATTQDISGLKAGDYTVTVTDANKCTAQLKVTITESSSIKLTETHVNVACNGGNTGSIDLTVTGGVAPYTYSWSNGATTEDISGLKAGDYTVTVTDANKCTATLKVTITESSSIKLTETHTDVACNGGKTGSIDLSVTGGTAPYTYSWSNGATTQDLSGLAAGDYTVTVTDANKCTATLKVTIKEASAIVLSGTVTNVACNGGKTGSIDLSVSGGTAPYTYLWSNGATTQDISGLAAGTYSVTVTDANKCTATKSFTVIEASAIKLTETHTNVSCYGANNGSIDLSVSGGTSPYTYLWSNGATTQDISGLAPGTYTVTVTDANKCTATLSITITQPPVVTCTLTAPTTLPICGSTGNTLTATTSVTGATYAWSVTGTGWAITGGQGTGTITYTAGSNGTLGTFTLKITKDGCSSTCTVTFGCKATIVQGCTPGFWKNTRTRWDQASDAVPTCIAAAISKLGSPYKGTATTTSLFRDVFGLTPAQMIAVGLDPNMTLIQALNLGGGNCYKLARHAVAALLSSCGLKYYTYTTAQVLTMTHNAIVNKTCEPTASKLAAANEAGSCPLSSDGNQDRLTYNKLGEPIDVTTEEVNKLTVEATPNPFYTRIRFEIHSPVSGQGQLDLYNVLGQKMGTAYQGYIEAGKSKTIEYSVPSALRTDLIYRMSVGTHSATGKLIQAPR